MSGLSPRLNRQLLEDTLAGIFFCVILWWPPGQPRVLESFLVVIIIFLCLRTLSSWLPSIFFFWSFVTEVEPQTHYVLLSLPLKMCADTPSSHGAGIKPKASFSSAHWTAHKASPPSFLLLVKVDLSNFSLIQTTATLFPQFPFNNTDVEGLRNKTGFVEFFF